MDKNIIIRKTSINLTSEQMEIEYVTGHSPNGTYCSHKDIEYAFVFNRESPILLLECAKQNIQNGVDRFGSIIIKTEWIHTDKKETVINNKIGKSYKKITVRFPKVFSNIQHKINDQQ